MILAGFYKQESEATELLYEPKCVRTSDHTLLAKARHEYTYPVDGWIWFDNIESAYSFHGLATPEPEAVAAIQSLTAIDWQGLMNDLDMPPVGNGLFAEMVMINVAFAFQGYNMCLTFLRGGGSEAELRTLEFTYSVLSQYLSPSRVQALRDVLIENNIPIQVGI